MRVAIRTDASPTIGTGHVMRCLVLSDLLRQAGAKVLFVCRPGYMNDYISSRGYPVSLLDASAILSQVEDADATAKLLDEYGHIDWLIVDHYGLDVRWESRLESRVGRIMVIDDLANRPHRCHLLLDIHDSGAGNRYSQLVPSGCQFLLGLRYLLLDDTFYTERKRIKVRSGEVGRLFIFYGGSDPTGETEKALHAVKEIDKSWTVDVVIGRSNLRAETIRRLCQFHGCFLHMQTSNMAQLMAKADLAMGAGGVSLWERCFLGLPAMVTAIAGNQRLSVASAAGFGAIWDLGWHADTSIAYYRRMLEKALQEKEKIGRISERSLQLTASVWNGNGHHPVVEEILRLTS